MSHRAVIFDLDGTLIDSLADIGMAANSVLESFSLPLHPLPRYKDFIGEGVGRLFQRALPEANRTEDWITRSATAFQAAYANHWNQKTALYPGISDLLDVLRTRQIPMAVLSNKPDAFTRKCVDYFLAPWNFAAVAGEKPPTPRKPDPQGALLIAQALQIEPQEILYLGDTPVDMETARRAGMTAIGVAWGFRPAAELTESGAAAVINTPLEALRWF
jgi:phosphoglycolate phosphatase